jgi:hypothetical protein
VPRGDFARVLSSLGQELDQGGGFVRRITQGGVARLDAAQLIAIQAGVYRYAEAVELMAKFVDKATNAVRTTLQAGSG